MISLSVNSPGSFFGVNGIPVNISVFKGGEVNVVIPENVISALQPRSNYAPVIVQVRASLTDSNKLMALMLVVDAIRRVNPEACITAVIPYFPYARQDRVCNPGEALSVSVVAGMINSLNLNCVEIVDPHSGVTPALIKNVQVRDQAYYMNKVRARLADSVSPKDVWLMAPDQGAYKKVLDLVAPNNFAGFMHAIKERDPKTMEIKQVKIQGDVQGKHILVVDDICDGGRTFLELGAILREQKAASIRLFVTHGIFSYGTKKLCEMYDEVITTHSFHDPYTQAQTPELTHKNLYWLYC